MSTKIDWARTLRAIVVAAVLLIALIGAVLASVGTNAPVWLWAFEVGPQRAALAAPAAYAAGAALPHKTERPA
jgi:hypothetical protein